MPSATTSADVWRPKATMEATSDRLAAWASMCRIRLMSSLMMSGTRFGRKAGQRFESNHSARIQIHDGLERQADQAGVDDRAHVLAALGVCHLQLVNGLTNHARQHCEKLPIASRQAAVAAVQAA